MKTAFAAFITSICFAASVSASVLATTAGNQSIEGIQIAKEGTVSLEGQSIPVSIVGAGLRAKKVAIVNVKVYVAELLSSDASKFVRDEANALKSLDQSRTAVLRMSFLRSVDAPTVQAAFVDGFKANNINTTEPAIAQFLKAVAEGGDASSGKALTVVTQKNADKTETLYYEDSNGHVTKIEGQEGLSMKIMALWLGATADSGVQKMKEQIIKGF